MKRLVLMFALALTFLIAYALSPLSYADAHWKPGVHNRYHAIIWGFCNHQYRPCVRGLQAIRVARCESGWSLALFAGNGQYQGMFQMGSWARARFGHSTNPWGQAAAAYRYYRVSGWAPWECAGIVGVG